MRWCECACVFLWGISHQMETTKEERGRESCHPPPPHTHTHISSSHSSVLPVQWNSWWSLNEAELEDQADAGAAAAGGVRTGGNGTRDSWPGWNPDGVGVGERGGRRWGEVSPKCDNLQSPLTSILPGHGLMSSQPMERHHPPPPPHTHPPPPPLLPTPLLFFWFNPSYFSWFEQEGKKLAGWSDGGKPITQAPLLSTI